MRLGKLVVIVLGLSIYLPAHATDEARSDDSATNATHLLSREPGKCPVEIQIEELRNALESQMATSRAQEQRIAALESELRAARSEASAVAQPAAESTSAEAPATADAQSDQKIEALAAEVASVTRSLAERLKTIGPFSFSGDIRLRDEPFIGGPADQSQVRNRERFRL